MTLGQGTFLLLCAGASMALLVWSLRRDRVLGIMMVFALGVYLAGAVSMGFYLERSHGRDHSAADELGFLGDGELIARSWQTGEPYEPGTRGVYARWNAVVVTMWGRSLVPLRLANAIVGAAVVVAVFVLGAELFGSLLAARLAAILALLSPSLFAWSLLNLRERLLGLLLVLAVLSAIRLIHRWSWQRLCVFLFSLWVLGETRVHYAAVLGWVTVASYPGVVRMPIRSRVLTSAVVFVGVGLVLLPLTQSFMGTSLRNDTARRYVTIDMPARLISQQQPSRAAGQPTADSAAAGDQAASAAAGDQAASAGAGDQTAVTTAPDAPRSVGRATTDVMPEDLLELLRRLGFVLFGRFEARDGAGRLMSIFLLPDWMLTFLSLPVAVFGVLLALRTRRREVLLPAAYIAANIAMLTWIHGDTWTTARFRVVYWPLFLAMAAGGASLINALMRPEAADASPRSQATAAG